MGVARHVDRVHYAWIILVVGTLVVFGSLGLARFGYTAILPSMQEDMGLNDLETGVLATANLVGYLLLSVLGGALASRYGPRRVVSCGLALAGIAMPVRSLPIPARASPHDTTRRGP